MSINMGFEDNEILFACGALLVIVFLYLSYDIVYNLIKEYKKYKSSNYGYLNAKRFYQVLFSPIEQMKYNTFSMLEKVCTTGHILGRLNIQYDGTNANYDMVMIDKYGISIFEFENRKGEISGSDEDYVWTIKNKFFKRKINNVIRDSEQKMELLKEILKLSDSRVINTNIVFDKDSKFRKIRNKNKNIRFVKAHFVNGIIAYESHSQARVLSDSEIKAYTIMLEQYSKMPIELKKQHLDMFTGIKDEDEKVDFIFTPKVASYNDLKRIWNLLCDYDKDYVPALSQRRKDIDSMSEYEKDHLLPNVFYRHIIEHPFILVKHNDTIAGFLSFEAREVMNVNELGKVNFVNVVCVDEGCKIHNLERDLYEFLENRVPEQYTMPNILVKSWITNMRTNKMLQKIGYNKIKTVKSKNKDGIDNVYYTK